MIRKTIAKIVFSLSLMLCLASYAQAHKVNIFASLDGNMIVGRVYFSGGGVAEDVDVDVSSQDGLKVATVKTNAKGEFLFIPKIKDAQYMFSVDTGDGHAAKTTVAVGSVPVQAAAVKQRPPTLIQLQGKADAQATQQAQGNSQHLAIDPSIIADVVAMELSKQLLPLSERIDRYESRLRFTGIVGGIGFIVGIAGVAAFIMSRRQRTTPEQDSKGKGK